MSIEFYRIFSFALLLCIVKMSCIANSDLRQTQAYNNSYCLPVVAWNISQNTLSQYQSLDTIARSRYTTLYNLYKDNKIKIDCLGMAKYFYCASAFPICLEGEQQRKSMCTWLCDLFLVRCPTAVGLVEDFCAINGFADTTCAFSGLLPVFLAFSLLAFIFL